MKTKGKFFCKECNDIKSKKQVNTTWINIGYEAYAPSRMCLDCGSKNVVTLEDRIIEKIKEK